MTAVILSVAALEATINEVARELQSDGNLRIDRETFDRFKIRVKWRTLPLLCGYARTFDRGAAPWTGFDTLVKLRNELVHANWQRPEPACVLTLAKQGHLLRNPNEGSYSWCDAVCTDRVAQWATDVVAQMCAELARLVEKDTADHWPWNDLGNTFASGPLEPGQIVMVANYPVEFELTDDTSEPGDSER